MFTATVAKPAQAPIPLDAPSPPTVFTKVVEASQAVVAPDQETASEVKQADSANVTSPSMEDLDWVIVNAESDISSLKITDTK